MTQLLKQLMKPLRFTSGKILVFAQIDGGSKQLSRPMRQANQFIVTAQHSGLPL